MEKLEKSDKKLIILFLYDSKNFNNRNLFVEINKSAGISMINSQNDAIPKGFIVDNIPDTGLFYIYFDNKHEKYICNENNFSSIKELLKYLNIV